MKALFLKTVRDTLRPARRPRQSQKRMTLVAVKAAKET